MGVKGGVHTADVDCAAPAGRGCLTELQCGSDTAMGPFLARMEFLGFLVSP